MTHHQLQYNYNPPVITNILAKFHNDCSSTSQVLVISFVLLTDIACIEKLPRPLFKHFKLLVTRDPRYAPKILKKNQDGFQHDGHRQPKRQYDLKKKCYYETPQLPLYQLWLSSVFNTHTSSRPERGRGASFRSHSKCLG